MFINVKICSPFTNLLFFMDILCLNVIMRGCMINLKFITIYDELKCIWKSTYDVIVVIWHEYGASKLSYLGRENIMLRCLSYVLNLICFSHHGTFVNLTKL